jgi:hypothetical protein
VVAQATTVITLLVAFIYVSGALTLIFKLWYLRVSSDSVLGQLPHDFIITTAFTQVIVPTLAVAGILTFVHARYLRWSWAHKARPRWRHAGVKSAFVLAGQLLLNLVLVGPALLILSVMKRHGNAAVLRDPRLIIVVCEILAVLPLVSYHVVRKVDRLKLDVIPKYLGMLAIYMLALTPVAAAVSASTLLPVVTLCGNAFPAQHVSKGVEEHFIRGNLIGSNSQDIYIAQWHLGADGKITPSNQIAVVPQSMVDLEVLGPHANCNDLA